MTLIEKVSGLEKLAEAGLPVPSKRLLLSAEEMRSLGPEAIASFLEGLPISGIDSGIIIRSAHPLEDRFSSGAFSSPGLELDPSATNDATFVWGKIQVLHARMIAAAEPTASLHIRRDLRFKGIEGYDPKDMGVYLNSAVGKLRHLTVIPREGRMIVQFRAGDFPLEYDFAHPIDHIRDKLVSSPFKLGNLQVEGLKVELDRANEVMGGPKEYEVLVDYYGKVWFVQARTPDAPKPQDLSRMSEWERGIRGYQARDCRHVYRTNLLALRADTAPEVRSTKVLIVDEGKWTFEGSDGLEKNYARLSAMAEEIPDYSLWVKDLSVTGAKRRHPMHAVRDQLADCASVQIRGWSDRDGGVEDASPHVPFGTSGPRQVGVHYEKGNLNNELGRLKDGNQLSILLKDGEASLILNA